MVKKCNVIIKGDFWDWLLFCKDILISYIFLCNFFNLSLLNKIKKKN